MLLVPSPSVDEKLNNDPQQTLDVAAIGTSVLRKEADALSILATQLDTSGSDLNISFVCAVHEIANRAGRVVVSGMGKSGHIARKIAATLASTGTSAFFVHPAEASHGDLGMIVPGDVVIVLSNSGKSPELSSIIKYTKRYRMPLIAVTSNKKSPLGKAADIVLALPKVPEACALGLAPTTSTTMTLALGDALAVATMQRKGFTSADFGKFHPGGSLGNMLQLVSEIMHQGDGMPLVYREDSVQHVNQVMSDKGMHCAGVISKREGKLIGIITQGDIGRKIGEGLFGKTAKNLMARKPITIGPSVLTAEALRVIEEQNISQLFITDEKQRPIGIVSVHDLLKAGVA